MLEGFLSVVAEGTARIRHADTGVVYEIHPDELDWQEVAGEERQMGMEVGSPPRLRSARSVGTDSASSREVKKAPLP